MYSVKQFAEVMGWKEPKVRRWIAKRKIKTTKVGWVHVIDQSEVDRLKQQYPKEA